MLLLYYFSSNYTIVFEGLPRDILSLSQPANQPDKVTKQEVPKKNAVLFSNYSQALKSRASKENIIYLAFVDLGAMSMALNFYNTSFHRLNITNYLFLSSSQALCDVFLAQKIPCFLYVNDSASDKESLYQSRDFKRKMNIRTFMVLEALQMGYHVIHTDVDMYFFKDPLASLTAQCNSNCDIAPLWDHGAHNAGFLYIRNTPASISVYERMKHIAQHSSQDDQQALNTALHEGAKKGLKIKKLNDKEFLCGIKFFEFGHRTFAGDNPCTVCIVVHNNWIVSTEAKVYRFKELHMWVYDGGRYYSDSDRKYLSYDNPTYFENDTVTICYREDNF